MNKINTIRFWLLLKYDFTKFEYRNPSLLQMMSDFVEDEEESENEEQDIWSRNNDEIISHYLDGFDDDSEDFIDFSKSVIRLDRRHNVIRWNI